MAENMTKIRPFLLLLAGIIIVIILVFTVGFKDVLDVLTQANPFILAAAVVCEAGAVFLGSLKWKTLLSAFSPVSMKNAIKGILIGIFFNNVTPVARTGGEPFRAYFMEKKDGISFGDSFAAVALDRIIDSVPFMTIISISIVYFVLLLNLSTQVLIIIILALTLNVGALLLVLYFSLNLEAAKKLAFSFMMFVARFSNRLEKYEKSINAVVEQYHKAIKTIAAGKKNLAYCVCVSFGFWFLTVLRGYLVVLALGYEVDFMVVVVIQMVGILVGAIPLLPGGLGSTDGIMMLLYYSFQFPAALAVTASLLDRFISFWIMTAVGGIFVFMEREFLQCTSFNDQGK
ncbi:MAG: flippase-like domain-containing protein [Theionarchaea archaeon]|nr:flippase-like domain-containing protein [Theionarchaea archaeon]